MIDARSDERLLAAARAGDASAFRELYVRHRPAVQRVVGARLFGREQEDAVQETFARALAGIQGQADPRNVGAWLRGIARFVCIDEAASNVETCYAAVGAKNYSGGGVETGCSSIRLGTFCVPGAGYDAGSEQLVVGPFSFNVPVCASTVENGNC